MTTIVKKYVEEQKNIRRGVPTKGIFSPKGNFLLEADGDFLRLINYDQVNPEQLCSPEFSLAGLPGAVAISIAEIEVLLEAQEARNEELLAILEFVLKWHDYEAMKFLSLARKGGYAPSSVDDNFRKFSADDCQEILEACDMGLYKYLIGDCDEPWDHVND